MRWKLFQLGAIVNLFSVAAFFALAIYFISLPSTETDPYGMSVCALVALASVTRDLLGLHYIRSLLSRTFFEAKYKGVYLILSVVTALIAAIIVYSVLVTLNQFTLMLQQRLIILWHLILVVFSVSSLLLALLDFFLFAELEKRKDPSIGILEEEP